MIPDDARELLDEHFGSLWALELILLMRKERTRAWRMKELVSELRASDGVIAGELPPLIAANLVAEAEPGKFRYSPASAELDLAIENLARVYREFPVAVVRHIALTPARGLKQFADAFKFRKD